MNNHAVTLASLVSLRPPPYGDDACPAWVESAGRRCGRPLTVGYLCARHHQAALRRLAAKRARAEKAAAKAAARRAELLPVRRARLVEVLAEIKALEPDVPEAAAVTGAAHPQLLSKRARQMTDRRIRQLALLADEAEALKAWLGPDREGRDG